MHACIHTYKGKEATNEPPCHRCRGFAFCPPSCVVCVHVHVCVVYDGYAAVRGNVCTHTCLCVSMCLCVCMCLRVRVRVRVRVRERVRERERVCIYGCKNVGVLLSTDPHQHQRSLCVAKEP